MTDLDHVEEFAKEAILEYLPIGWGFKWNNRTSSFGRCNYARKIIELSIPLMQAVSDDEAIDTVLHEIAHALVLVEFDVGIIKADGHHGPLWKAMCKRIGANPKANGPMIPAAKLMEVHRYKWVIHCTKCGEYYPKARKPKYSIDKYRCPCSKESHMVLIQKY
jgi:predicted SprT family Zn-dependent metalloprotease